MAKRNQGRGQSPSLKGKGCKKTVRGKSGTLKSKSGAKPSKIKHEVAKSKARSCDVCRMPILPNQKLWRHLPNRHHECGCANRQFHYQLATKDELRRGWADMKVSQPDRCKALQQQFMLTGDWPAVVNCIKEFVKSDLRDESDGLVKVNELSFFRHYLSAGLQSSKVKRMWHKGVDEKGCKLQETTNKKGERCYFVEQDEKVHTFT